ncbi:MAG: oxidoreductase [Acidimicrobiia bacterium]|nr:MAG: oxidoreductase [Acidimicrobiia bacterium]
MPPDLLARLARIVGDAHVLTDADTTAGHTVDWTGRFRGPALAVVRPGTTAEVAQVVRECAQAGVGVVPQGGNTGLVGGSVPRGGEVVCSLRRLTRLDAVDLRTGQVTAGAGVTLARLREHARAAGWDYGVDLAARDSATVGGMVATNAGGVHVLRHGPTRRQLVGVEAVLADGSVVGRLDGLEKDNTGYDLAGLLCGSEGTLGVVTAARLRLVPPAREVVVVLLAFDDLDDALDAVGHLRRDVDCLSALELFLQDGLDLVCAQLGLRAPFTGAHRAYVLAEAAAASDPTPVLAGAVDALAAVADVAVATDPEARRALWRYREAHTEAVNRLGPPHKLDVALPAGALAEFVTAVPAAVETVAPGARVWLFGHAGDGNVHVNVTGVAPDDARVTDTVLRMVAQRRGSISAEHGIGVAKRAWLHLVRSEAEIAAYRAVKDALDPRGILNPGVLLPPR